tara:strand:- start:13453 stop:14193 length:741 start_codon:yes stop_codon:yes gene_type:complete
MTTEYERLGGWKGLPNDLWLKVESYTQWDIDRYHCGPLYDIQALWEISQDEERSTKHILEEYIKDGITDYRELQKVAMAIGVSGRDKAHILVRNISNKVPNYEIHRNLKEAEIKVFNESAKRAAKMEREELSKLWDINNKYYGSFCFKKNWLEAKESKFDDDYFKNFVDTLKKCSIEQPTKFRLFAENFLPETSVIKMSKFGDEWHFRINHSSIDYYNSQNNFELAKLIYFFGKQLMNFPKAAHRL